MFNSEIQPVQHKSRAGVFCTQFIHLTETGCCDQNNFNSKVKKRVLSVSPLGKAEE